MWVSARDTSWTQIDIPECDRHICTYIHCENKSLIQSLALIRSAASDQTPLVEGPRKQNQIAYLSHSLLCIFYPNARTSLWTHQHITVSKNIYIYSNHKCVDYPTDRSEGNSWSLDTVTWNCIATACMSAWVSSTFTQMRVCGVRSKQDVQYRTLNFLMELHTHTNQINLCRASLSMQEVQEVKEDIAMDFCDMSADQSTTRVWCYICLVFLSCQKLPSSSSPSFCQKSAVSWFDRAGLSYERCWHARQHLTWFEHTQICM